MKINFYLNRKSAIYCYVRENKSTLTLNTGQTINPDVWDSEIQRANLRKTRDNIVKKSLKDLNQYLNAFQGKIEEIERMVRRKKFSAGFGVVSDEIKKHFTKKKTGLFEIYDEFIKIRRQEVSKVAIQKFNRVKSLLIDYQKTTRERVDFDRITPLFFSKFLSFLIENKNMLNNTAHKNIQFLKTFLIWANNNGYTDNQSFRTFRSKSEVNEVIYLNEKELMILYNMELNDERLDRVRDIFIFQCFTGVRYSDIQNISREDINGSVWKVRVQKTHQIIEIPLNSYAISILAKYREYPKPLPVISNQKMNKYLKELCEFAGIDESVKIVKYKGSERIEKTFKKFEILGTHTARRTFISLSLQKGMKPDVIMAITGHTTYRMMQKYLKIADEQKREEMDKVWGSSLRLVKT